MAVALDAVGGGAVADLQIDSMPDCRLKYELIVRRANAKGEKFTDK